MGKKIEFKGSISESIDEVQLTIPKDVDVGWKFWKKRRNVVGLLVFLGFFMSNSLRVNLSIAVVVMTTSTGNVKPEFDWNSDLRGVILGSFFYGYTATQFLGGYLSSKIGGKKVLGVGIGATALLTLTTPLLTRTSVYLLIFLRIVMGLFEGVTFPSTNSIWANWAPPTERSKLSTLPFSGSTAGAVIAMPLSSIIAARLGWPAIFYINGLMGLIWFAAWMYFISDTPRDDPWISVSELEYLEKTLCKIENNKKNISHPWKEMLTSVPVWAIFVAHFCGMWGYHTMVMQLPLFIENVLHFEIEKTGFVSALPYLGLTIVMVLSGHIADYLLSNNYLSTTMKNFDLCVIYWTDNFHDINRFYEYKRCCNFMYYYFIQHRWSFHSWLCC
ncbi:sialin-like isoform X2 [Aphidius gifuensis]|uniref:sialin-like isoform X2 n=1 Tax=Aphidius gifuensis TaxID=684658 RepID=UPI001CDBC81B|nr:sialin-like isoform X2 [Aphidius gifuensis]